jgi:glycerol-3-phosphate dehydrogenase
MYDILAGKENMESSYLMSKGKALEIFPMLKSDGLVGAVVYYDGAHKHPVNAYYPRLKKMNRTAQRLAHEHGPDHDRGETRRRCSQPL